MRAARFHGQGDVRIEDIPEPAVGPRGVKIKVAWCGICGTDLHEYTDGPIFCPTPDVPHPLTGETSPVVLGHEFAGTVIEVGAEVSTVQPGMRVAVEPRIVCGECPPCRAGHRNSCQSAATIGLAGGGGGLAELIVADESLVFDLGELPLDVGALVEPLAVAVHAIRQSEFVPGQTAVVFGAGPIGLLIASVLKAQGAAFVMLVEPSPARRQLADSSGADVVADPIAEDPVAIALGLTDQAGVDVVFECAGVDAALRSALDVVKASGVIVNVAIRSADAKVDLLPLVLKEVRLVGTICYSGDFPAVIELLQSGRLSVEHLITKRISLDDLVPEGIHSLLHDTGEQAKILVDLR